MNVTTGFRVNESKCCLSNAKYRCRRSLLSTSLKDTKTVCDNVNIEASSDSKPNEPNIVVVRNSCASPPIEIPKRHK